MQACLPCLYFKPICIANLKGFEIITSRACCKALLERRGLVCFHLPSEFQTFSCHNLESYESHCLKIDPPMSLFQPLAACQKCTFKRSSVVLRTGYKKTNKLKRPLKFTRKKIDGCPLLYVKAMAKLHLFGIWQLNKVKLRF